MSKPRIFKPRDKNSLCDHWIDCYKRAEWVAEVDDEGDLIYLFFCEHHKNEFVGTARQALQETKQMLEQSGEKK